MTLHIHNGAYIDGLKESVATAKRDLKKIMSYCVHNQSSPMQPKRYCGYDLGKCPKHNCPMLKGGGK